MRTPVNAVRTLVAYGCSLRAISMVLMLFVLGSWNVSQTGRSSGLTVYVFLSTECPISQQYARTLEALHLRFKPSGVRFVAMFPLRTDSPRLINRFRTEYNLSFAGQPDSGARLARQLRVRTTPEVVVMQADGAVRYQGAIDDWYVSLGKRRPEVTNAYLQNALGALLSGQAVMYARTEAVGCLLD